MYVILALNKSADILTPSVYNLQFFFYCPLMVIFFVALTWSTAPMAAFSKDFEKYIGETSFPVEPNHAVLKNHTIEPSLQQL